MRDSFHSELESLREQLSAMCAQAVEALRSAGRAVLEADHELAERVVAADREIDLARDRCDETAQRLLALQAPVASDLRLVITAVHCADKIERMGDLAAHIADTARLAHPACVVPAELTGAVTELGTVAAGMADRLVELLREPRSGGYAQLNETDQTVDAIHAELMNRITDTSWAYGIPSATSLALLVRFYERFADQAVSVAKRLDFACTGIMAA
ncbi:phosphate signaling complex protein PhoU [Actinophytocola xanthii]|uniref:Phosphate-specific transport system accessory protein PhoU n=1 Tax=Actinophytocola xanthii TaxID=1912961 RepID=A0A1Q8C0K0_9PSEU|nr:phosphate signaling complex protein PhoU [Actinophytocola xanthii]OLF07874.1 phosphate transport system regulatory protein PhoU [Actinophytocola xanthii]